MNGDELAQIRKPIERMNEICAESEEIRAQLTNMTPQRPVWPDSRRASRLFSDLPRTSAKQTPSNDDNRVN